MVTLQFEWNASHYVKNPQDSDLGKKIVGQSVELLDQMGYEHFNFKKLAATIETTEATIYRYFENKLQLLLYLTTLYWKWMDYLIDYKTHHMPSSLDKILLMFEIICDQGESGNLPVELGLNEKALKRVLITESDKTFLVREVDQINHKGMYKDYKNVCMKISDEIININPLFPYPRTMASMLLETIHQQQHFSAHLPSLTEISSKNGITIQQYIKDMINLVLNSYGK